MATLRRQDLKLALSHHQAGRLGEARGLYRRVLAAEPNNPDARHLLGLLSLTRGDLAEAAEHFGQLVAVRPRIAEYRSNYGHTLRLMGDLLAAELELVTATKLDPDFADGWVNLGLVRLDRRDIPGAIEALEVAVAKAPGSALAQLNLGSALRAAGRLDEATARLRVAVELAPDLAPAHHNLAMLHRLGGRLDEAVSAYRRALALCPDDAGLLTDLGVVLVSVGDLEGAIACHDRAVVMAPDSAVTWLNRGTALQAVGRLDEARICFTRAAAIEPSPKPLTALGSVAAEQGNFGQAVIEHERALAIDPSFADGHWNLALALLGSGEVTRGFAEYEWRWRASSRTAELRRYPWPVWQGEPVAGTRLLVWREQGLGDELLFLTCLRDLVDAGAAVTLLVSPRLVSLLARSFPGVEVRADGPLPSEASFDWHLPMGSLAHRLRRDRAAFAAARPYLVAGPAALATWGARLAPLGDGPRIGVCWRSGLLTAERQRHYPPMAAWDSLWRIPGPVWINLQYDECEAELSAVEGRTGVRIHRWAGDDLKNDLESVVGLLGSLDAVVTAPTAVSSLAGAVGVRTWQLDSGSDWTVLGEQQSPWMPSIRVIKRQPSEGSWIPAIDRLAGEVSRWIRDERKQG